VRGIERVDVAIVGGGIAGLVAASYAARGGRSVAVFERSEAPGGRARTTRVGGFALNLGAHALSVRGANAPILDELGITVAGSQPEAGRFRAMRGGYLHSLPTSGLTLASTRLLGLRAKVEFGRFYASMGGIDPRHIDGVTVRDWIDGSLAHPTARAAFEAIIRFSTYTNDPGRASAGAVLRQLRVAAGGVRYLDGGWQALVEALRRRAIDAGARVEAGTPVRRLEVDGDAAAGVMLDGDRLVRAGAVIVATPLAEAATVTGLGVVAAWAGTAIPVRAAVLDLGLASLPNPRTVLAVGIDRPTYFAVHSAWAKLAPGGQHVVHVMTYLRETDDGPAPDRTGIDEVLDTCQPGWRRSAVEQRYLPAMTVSSWLPAAASGGLDGRPGPAVPGVRNLFVAGDWVGPEGMLADVAFASGRRAGVLAGAAAVPAAAGAVLPAAARAG
jgi:phytoene dehydrogenase-like protein